MKSNSLDGEFIRLLSGTHHIATSFKRAGLCEGDETAWIVDLSCEQSDEMFTLHAEKMNFEIIDERPNISIFDASRMGIEGDASEDAAIGHIHSLICARTRKCERAPTAPGIYGGRNSAIRFDVL